VEGKREINLNKGAVMRALKVKGIVMVALALCLGSVSLNGNGKVWASDNPTFRIDEFGHVGMVSNGTNGIGNAFTDRPEALPNLFALLIVGVSLLGVALFPSHYRETGEKEPGKETELDANLRDGKKFLYHGKSKSTFINKTPSALPPLSTY
jgi:hypothetical protein